MARPTRTFTGQEGQRATGSAGPDPIRRDFDAIFAMFNPEATLPTGEAGGIDASENMKAVQLDPNHEPDADAGKIPTILSGIVNRLKAITGMPDWKNTPPTTLAGVHNQVNNITVNQNQSPQSDTGNLQQMLSWIVNRLRAITGREDWKDDPGVTLQDISDKASHDDISFHAIAKSGVHGVGNAFVAKTSRSDQWPSWNDIPDKPTSFPTGPHQHSAQDIISGQLPPERIGNLPASKVTTGQFDAARIPNLPASKITSGTFDAARLPKASTSQQGIVQLTNSRSSASETLAVTAKALNDHRNSADHDGRYYTKAQVDQMIGGLGGSSKTPSGYVWLPGGLLLQWGRSGHITPDGSAVVHFPIPFPNQCFQVMATKLNPTDTHDYVICDVKSFSNTNAIIKMEALISPGASSRFAMYLAIGY